MCNGEEPTGCWTNLWCVPAKRRVVGKEHERAGGAARYSLLDTFRDQIRHFNAGGRKVACKRSVGRLSKASVKSALL